MKPFTSVSVVRGDPSLPPNLAMRQLKQTFRIAQRLDKPGRRKQAMTHLQRGKVRDLEQRVHTSTLYHSLKYRRQEKKGLPQ